MMELYDVNTGTPVMTFDLFYPMTLLQGSTAPGSEINFTNFPVIAQRRGIGPTSPVNK